VILDIGECVAGKMTLKLGQASACSRDFLTLDPGPATLPTQVLSSDAPHSKVKVRKMSEEEKEEKPIEEKPSEEEKREEPVEEISVKKKPWWKFW